MPSQHRNFVHSVLQVLSKEDSKALTIADIHESDMNGARRPGQETRANEGNEEAKRWCVVAVIV